MTLNKSGVNASFTYSIDGYRTKKTVNGVTTEYYLDGDRIAGLKKGSDELVFMYDENGLVIGFYYNGIPYIYVKNLQGDVIGIVDKNYDMVVTYSYDAWGKLLAISGDLANTIGKLNPFRYRSYVYDDETGLYYLNSRYYDAGVGRFLNADKVVAGVGQDVKGYNLYVYCFNNPVNMSDPTGGWPIGISWAAKLVQNIVVTYCKVSQDCKNYEKDNQSEKRVIEAHYFSSYKGKLVLKEQLVMGKSGFSYGVIFIGDDVRSADTVKHEYGHTVQLENRGIIKYTTEVVIPSVTAFVLDEIGKLPYDYYGSPWEAEADRYGGATNNDEPWPEEACDSYMDLIRLFFQ